jgi:hypothetical protein
LKRDHTAESASAVHAGPNVWRERMPASAIARSINGGNVTAPKKGGAARAAPPYFARSSQTMITLNLRCPIVPRCAALILILAIAYALDAAAQQPASIESRGVHWDDDGATLQGTLFLPGHGQVVAAVVLVDGVPDDV